MENNQLQRLSCPAELSIAQCLLARPVTNLEDSIRAALGLEPVAALS